MQLSEYLCSYNTEWNWSMQWQLSMLRTKSQASFTTSKVMFGFDSKKLNILQDCMTVGGILTYFITFSMAALSSVQMECRSGQRLLLLITSRKMRKVWTDLCFYIQSMSSFTAYTNWPLFILSKQGTIQAERSYFWLFISWGVTAQSLRMLLMRMTLMKRVGCLVQRKLWFLLSRMSTLNRLRYIVLNFYMGFSMPRTWLDSMGVTSYIILIRGMTSSSRMVQKFSLQMIFWMIWQHQSGRQSRRIILTRLMMRMCMLFSQMSALQLVSMVMRRSSRSHISCSLISGFVIDQLKSKLGSQYLRRVSLYSTCYFVMKMQFLRFQGTEFRYSFDIFGSKMTKRAPMNASWFQEWSGLTSLIISFDGQHVKREVILMMMSIIIAFERQLIFVDVWERTIMALSSLLRILVISDLFDSFTSSKFLRKVINSSKQSHSFMQFSLLFRKQQTLAQSLSSPFSLCSASKWRERVMALQMSRDTSCLQMVRPSNAYLILISLFLLMGLESSQLKQLISLRQFIVAAASLTIPDKISSLCPYSPVQKSMTLCRNWFQSVFFCRTSTFRLAFHSMCFTKMSKKAQIGERSLMRVISLMKVRAYAIYFTNSYSIDSIPMNFLAAQDSCMLYISPYIILCLRRLRSSSWWSGQNASRKARYQAAMSFSSREELIESSRAFMSHGR